MKLERDLNLFRLERIRCGDVRLISRERKGARSSWLQWLVVVVGIDNDVIHVSTHRSRAEAEKDFVLLTNGRKKP